MKEYIEKLQVDFLANSYLYYIKDKSVIPDATYDQLCKWLHGYMRSNAAQDTKYYELCKHIDSDGSGYYLKEQDYPDYITIISYKLLRQYEENKEICLSEIEKELETIRW